MECEAADTGGNALSGGRLAAMAITIALETELDVDVAL